MESAKFVDCPGMTNPFEHEMRDGCWSCAPYWERIPLCPVHNRKLKQTESTGALWKPVTKGWCKECRTHYLLEDIVDAVLERI
mgnify:CR=1 FL=1